MKVNLQDHLSNHEDFVGWLVIAALTKLGNLGDGSERSKKLLERDENGDADICLTFNGIELPFIETIKRLEEEFDHEVKKKADELIEERLSRKMNVAEDVVHDLISQLRTILAQAKSETANTRSKILFVEEKVANDMQDLCTNPSDEVGKDEVVFDREVVFNNGIRMAIQVCATTDPIEEPCWTQGVLFDKDGNELGCTNVGDDLFGEYIVWHDGTEYSVQVIKQKD